MNIQKTRFCFYAILLIVLSLLASCIDDNEPVDKQETVTLYVSANMGQTSGLTGTMHDCMLVKEKGDDPSQLHLKLYSNKTKERVCHKSMTHPFFCFH